MSKAVLHAPIPPKPSILQLLWTVIIFLATALYIVLLLDLPSLYNSGNGRILDGPATTSTLSSWIELSEKLSANSGLASVGDIYVISLKARQDRREQMDILAGQLSLHWQYIDAITATDRVVNATLEWVRETRSRAPTSFSKEEKGAPSGLNGSSTFTWPANIDSLAASDEYLDYWDPSDSPNLGDNLSSWKNNSAPLLAVTMQDYVLPMSSDNTATLQEYMLLSPNRVACWHSHLRVIHRIANSEAIGSRKKLDSRGELLSPMPEPASALATAAQRMRTRLILEDDVDIDRNINDQLSHLWGYLPDDWDIVFLGKSCLTSYIFIPSLKTFPFL